jgi:hypothetical protein
MLKYFPPERASIRSIRTESAVLAKKFKLQCQLDRLYMQGPNWYIADIDSDTLRNLESPRRGLILFRYWLSQLTGRNGKNQLLRNFFLSDTSLVNTLRLLSWLGPCPEISCLLLDWSRMNPSAGGFPMVLEPIIEVRISSRNKLCIIWLFHSLIVLFTNLLHARFLRHYFIFCACKIGLALSICDDR